MKHTLSVPVTIETETDLVCEYEIKPGDEFSENPTDRTDTIELQQVYLKGVPIKWIMSEELWNDCEERLRKHHELD